MIVFSRFHDPFDIVVMNARVRVLSNKRFILKKEDSQSSVDVFVFYYLYHTHNVQQSPNLILD